MADDDRTGPGRPGDADDGSNPFKGTPLEQFFGGAGGQTPDLGALFGQMQQMFSAQHDGAVDFDVATDLARQALTSHGPDPSTSLHDKNAIEGAVQLADGWLDRATDLPRAVASTAAWSRAEWVEETAGTWKQLVAPIAEHVVGAMSDALPEEARAMAGPLMGMLRQAGAAMFAQQIGQALGALGSEVLSSTDVGLPLGPSGLHAIVTHNVEQFGEGLEQSRADVLLYVVLREAAHHRLFSSAPWLRAAVVGAVEDFGRGTRIDLGAIEGQMSGLDVSDPQAIAEAMQGGMFEPEPTPEQRAALDRLELLLALIEGWVDEVVGQATAETMPSGPALAEAIRRRRATGGPAEQTFASLVGLELRPRRLREASTLWAAVRDLQGAEARDAVWKHPDLLPTAGGLDDPVGFAQRTTGAPSTDDFDAELGRLLDGDGDDPSA